MYLAWLERRGGSCFGVRWPLCAAPWGSSANINTSSYVDGRLTMAGAQVDKFIKQIKRLQLGGSESATKAAKGRGSPVPCS